VTRILIVDDEQSIRRSLGGILSDEGFETDVAADGRDCRISYCSTSPCPDATGWRS
jgi:two-component system nitrogen regulation response regulator NtrX